MLSMLLIVAAGLSEPAAAPAPAPAADPTITVRGRRPQRMICHPTTASGDSRIITGRVCLTQREWDERHDQAVELLNDMPRRNPRQAGRTIPDATSPQF